MKKLLVGLMLVFAAMGFGFAQSSTNFGDVVLTLAKAAGVSTDGGAAAVLARLLDRGLVDKKWATLPLDKAMTLDDFKVFVADVLNGTAAAPASVEAAEVALKAKGLDLSKLDSGGADAVGAALTAVVTNPTVSAGLASGYGNAVTPTGKNK